MANCNSIESLLNQLINEVNALKAKQPEGDWLSKVLELINALKAFVVDTINAAVSPLKTAIEQVQETIRASIAALERIIRDAIAALTGQLDREKSERQEADSSLRERLATLESRMAGNEAKVKEVEQKTLELAGVVFTIAGTLALVEKRVTVVEAELLDFKGNILGKVDAIAIGLAANTAIDVAQTAAIAFVEGEVLAIGGGLAALSGTVASNLALDAAQTGELAVLEAASAANVATDARQEAALAALAAGLATALACCNREPEEVQIVYVDRPVLVPEIVPYAVPTPEIVYVPQPAPYPVPYVVPEIVPYPVPTTEIVVVPQPTPYPVPTPQPYPVTTIVPYEIPVTNTVYIDRPLPVPVPTPYVVDKPVPVPVPTPYPVTEMVPYEKPVVVIQKEIREIDRPVIITQTEVREIEKPVVIRELPTCEELRLCLGERLIPRLPTCDEMQALDSCWPTENVSLPYAECEGGKGTVKSEQVKVLKGAVKPSVVDKFSKSANLGKDGCECVTELPGVSVPEWWEMRPEYERPQLCILFGLLDENTNKVGSAKYQVTIPHYNGEKPVKSPIPRYRKGSIYGILTLNDNSKVIVYAAAKEEAQKVIASAKRNIKAAQLGKATAKYGEMQGKERAPGVLVPREAHYYPKGLSKGAKPEWIQIFQKE